MGPFAHTHRALPGITLVVILAWALIAVMLLTGTLVNAQGIDRRVGVITGEVHGIDTDTGSVALAARTSRIAGRIARAAEPLAAELRQVTAAAGGIGRSASSIQSTADHIHGKATAVGRTVQSIGATATAIHGTVVTINGTVQSIHSRIARTATAVFSIGSSVASIHASGASILASARDIDQQVAGINRRADTIIGVARPIAADLADVFGMVGLSDGPNIRGHAHAIDCSRLLNVAGPTRSCG